MDPPAELLERGRADQQQASLGEVAKLARVYYRALRSEGFGRRDAFKLTLDFRSRVLTSTPPPSAQSLGMERFYEAMAANIEHANRQMREDEP